MIPRSSAPTATASAAFVPPRKYAELLPRASGLQAAASADAIFIDLLPRASARGVLIKTASATGARLQYADFQPPSKDLNRFVNSLSFPVVVYGTSWIR